MTSEVLERGRASFERQEWTDAFERLSAADRDDPLRPDDLERLAAAAFLLGHESESHDFWARAHQALLDGGEIARAVRCGFWIGFTLMRRGEMAPASGWFGRAQRLLDESGLECVERGYLLVAAAVQTLFAGDGPAAYEAFEKIGEIAERYGDPDLATLSRLGRGQASILMNRTTDGVPLLDEAMVAVTSGEASPIIAGLVYCAVIDACREIFDLRRAREWTAALTQWCEAQPDLVPFRGQCLVHRAEVMRLTGAWSEAMREAERARERLSEPLEPAVGEAYYLLGELHRLRGELSKAEDAYRQANRYGRSPEPGLALLRLSQSRVDAAEATIRRILAEVEDRVARSRILPAAVEIMLAAGDAAAARDAADELERIAADVQVPFLHAVAAHARGEVLLTEDDPGAAVASLRSAWSAWQELEAPYEAARSRVLIGMACRQLGDVDTAQLEFEAALHGFRELGAVVDLERVENLSRTPSGKVPGGLTPREVQVIALVATGKTNRTIAEELFLSEKTVARHLSNIFAKLGVSSRAAATAYAYEHGLV